MNDERLGMAAGALLRDQDRPAVDQRRSIGQVMTEVRLTPQARRSRWWPSLRGGTSRSLDLDGGASQDHPTYKTNGRTSRTAPAHTGGSRTMFGATKLFLVGIGVALVSVLLVSGVLPSGLQAPGATSPGAPGVAWTTERVKLTADDFRLEVSDLVFGDDIWPQSLNSDPGDSDYWTLEVVWFEHELEQRLNMYFGSDGSDWWVDEIRTYDGHERGEWVYAYGPFFQTPLGEAFEGDVTVDLLGEGRPEDPDDLVPAVLSFTGLRLAVSPGTGPTPGPVDVRPEESPADPDEEHPSTAVATLERALAEAVGDPGKGDTCLTVEETTAFAEEVLSTLGMTEWSVEKASGIDKDGCAKAAIGAGDQQVIVLTVMHPDAKAVLAEFFELSLAECFDEVTAVDTLTASLNEAGRTDFVVKVDSMLGGPSDRTEEIQAHADAGCVFYVGSGAEADGTPVYFLHGG
jgi:hypothetical protein